MQAPRPPSAAGLQVPPPPSGGRPYASQASLPYAPSHPSYATTMSPGPPPMGAAPLPHNSGMLYPPSAPGPPAPPGSMVPRPGYGAAPPPMPQSGMHMGPPPPASSVYPTPQQAWRPAVRKRLFVCCDGTWLDSDAAAADDPRQLQLPSNVTRIGRAVKPVSSDGVAQVVYYQAGVGTEGGYLSRLAGGATADGLAGNIREAYAFICLNWDPGDEIFLVGFSRGAYTARSVAGLIGQVGVLTKAGLKDLAVIFQDVQMRSDPKYESKYPGTPFPDKPSASDPRYAQELARLQLTRLGVQIKAIAVWDTVGSLGIPRVPWLERLGLQKRAVRDYAFYDTALGPYIENAFQALALDEMRSSFVPTLWEHPRPPGSGSRQRKGGASVPPPGPPPLKTNLRQVWFAGVHANVGGGYPDPGQANITLAWMVAQLEPYLDFDLVYLQAQWAAGRAYYAQTKQPPRPWSFGEVYRSMTGLYALAGATVRTPGRYHRLDPNTGAPTKSLLRDTCEYVHPSVRARIDLEGPGVEDRGVYQTKALADYTLRRTGADHGQGRPVAVWESSERVSKRKGGGPKRVLEESPLFATELVLLRGSPWVEQELFGRPPTGAGKSRRTAGGAVNDTFGPGSDITATTGPEPGGNPGALNLGYVAPTGRRRSDDDGGRVTPLASGALAGEGRRRKRRTSPGKKDRDNRRHSTRA